MRVNWTNDFKTICACVPNLGIKRDAFRASKSYREALELQARIPKGFFLNDSEFIESFAPVLDLSPEQINRDVEFVNAVFADDVRLTTQAIGSAATYTAGIARLCLDNVPGNGDGGRLFVFDYLDELGVELTRREKTLLIASLRSEALQSALMSRDPALPEQLLTMAYSFDCNTDDAELAESLLLVQARLLTDLHDRAGITVDVVDSEAGYTMQELTGNLQLWKKSREEVIIFASNPKHEKLLL